jgi:hypothetical protein
MRISLVAAFAALSLACSTPEPAFLSGWRESVVAAHQQSDVALGGVNELMREEALQRVAKLQTLKESDFTPALDANSLRIWNSTFSELEAYAAALEALVDPNLVAGVGPSLSTLGTNMAAKAKLDVFDKHPGLADAVSKAGTAIAGAAAGARAQEIMRETNPAIHDLLTELGKMLVDEKDGVEIGPIADMHLAWTDRAAEKRAEFARATSADAKRRIALEFVEILDKRDASDQLFRQLRSTLDSLAIDHAAAAAGQKDFGARVASLRQGTELAQQIVDDLAKTKP